METFGDQMRQETKTTGNYEAATYINIIYILYHTITCVFLTLSKGVEFESMDIFSFKMSLPMLDNGLAMPHDIGRKEENYKR